MGRDGKNKFYSKLDIPKDLKKLIKFYNKIWKKQTLK